MTDRPKTPLLDKVNRPADMKGLTDAQLTQLAHEVRSETISAVSETGGHLGAGLGVVELTVALHAVFDTPRDKLIWDVSHQCYPHKILTERRDRPAGERMTLIRVDLDHFKYVNDNLGHDAGDAVLCHVARTLTDCARDRDEVFRMGGDEFSILLSADGAILTAQEIVARVQEALAIPFLFEGQVCRFGASFGIAVANSGEISDAELNTFADVALYEAKARGGNRVEVFTDKLHRHIIGNRHLAVELEEALERNEFMPYFQPQICARTGALAGMETLARWQHPTRGVLSPEEFMDVANQINVAPMIDQMIFRKTREVLRDWRAREFHPTKISFNVSSDRMQNNAILDGARALLSDGVRVGFELLESILVEDETEAFRHQLDALRKCGIQIEIDDFGSGHASIVGLMECDPAVLKIDRRLVSHIEDNAQGQHLITAIIGMARALDISVTVEGVETQEQAETLRGLGCDVFQGFLFSRPLDPEAMFAFAKDLRSSAA